MQAKQINFLQFLQGIKQFVIPIYQRTYSWKIEECRTLWNDILRVAQNDEIPTHFLGSIVYVSKGVFQVASVPKLLVIDGQQRLTTLFLLLVVLAETLEIAGDEQGGKITSRKLRDRYFFNDEIGDDQYKLLLTQNDKDTLIALLEGDEEPATISPRLKENYQFFKEQINKDGVTPEILYKGINKLIIVDIALEQHDNPQLIFESLNSTGMDLTQTDLIRNYVLMGLDNKEQTELYQKYWYPMEQDFGQTQNADRFNRFMRDFLTLRTGTIPNVNEVYTAFKAYYPTNSYISIEHVVKEVYQYARYFTRMVLAHEKDAELKRCFEDIRVLEVNVVYPFLLEVYSDYEALRLSHADFIAILKLIESYVFRRMICRMYASGLNKVFATLAKEIDKEHYLESVQANFLQRSYGTRFPRDEEFDAAFVVKDIYNFRNRRYLLSKLENYKRKERVNVDEYTTEHILPQNPKLSMEWQEELGPNWQEVQRTYLHTIGNLTLTAYNPDMSDHPFREKRDKAETGLAYSPLHLNAGLGQVEHWNASAIKQRAQRLAKRALQIWAQPELTAEQLNKYGLRAQRTGLIEVIGPVVHPLAGIIPDGYKIVPQSDKRFYYYRLIDHTWIQYGNGKYPWFRNSWEEAGKRLLDFAQKDIKPLGVGGELVVSNDSLELDRDSDYSE